MWKRWQFWLPLGLVMAVALAAILLLTWLGLLTLPWLATLGFAAVCGVKFNPISGYRTDDPDIRLISQSNEIEVWLVSLPKMGMYVPYRIVLPTVSGYASATSSFLKIQADAKSTALRF